MLGRLFVVSAPSGAGKTTLVNHILGRFCREYPLAKVITYTTKHPRTTDIPGQDYHFISVAEFERRIAEGYFLEWSNAYGHYYGSPRTILQDLTSGEHRVIITDRVGARALKEVIPEAVLIWLYTQNLQILQERLEKRGQESLEQMSYRLNLAKAEIDQEKQTPLYEFHVLNQNFFEALDLLSTIFLKKMLKNEIISD
jgi:guanylate kinase